MVLYNVIVGIITKFYKLIMIWEGGKKLKVKRNYGTHAEGRRIKRA